MKTRTIWLMPLLFGALVFTAVSPGCAPERRARMSDQQRDIRDGISVALAVAIVMLLAREGIQITDKK